uniref:Uncharacterized protein n=1 Tax=Solanum tuberosum TaxID=4113 RepID=M1AVU6_SOLTU
MEPVGPHGQNDPFSRSNDPRRRILTSFLHKFFMNVRYDLNCGAVGPHRAGTIIKTLAMEPVGPHGQNDSFSRSNAPRSRIRTSFLLKSFMDVRLDLNYGDSLPLRLKRPIFKVKRTPEQVNPLFYRFSFAIIHHLFGDPEFRTHFCRNLSWTFVKTLSMKPGAKTDHFQRQLSPGAVGSHGQNDPFSGSNVPRSRKTPHFANFLMLQSMDFLASVKTLAMEQVVTHGQNGPFSRPNDPKSRISTSFLVKIFMDIRSSLSYGASCPSRLKRPYFQGQTSTGAEIRLHFSQNFSWTSVKTLVMEPIVPHSQNGPFSRSSYPRAEMSVKTLAMEPIGPHGQNGPFSRSNDPRSM